jgi:hypothetical protein
MTFPYPLTSPQNGVSQDLFPFKIDDMQDEWVYKSPVGAFIGSRSDRPFMSRTFEKGAGISHRIPRLQAMDYTNYISGFGDREGNEQQLQVDSDSIFIDWKTWQLRENYLTVQSIGTPINVASHFSSQIVEAMKRMLTADIISAFTTDLYQGLVTGGLTTGNVAGSFPSYDRAVVFAEDGSLVARAAYQANGTFPTLLDGMQAIGASTPAGSGMSAKKLRQIANYLTFGNAYDIAPNTEWAIKPAYVGTKNGWPDNKYILMLDPLAVDILREDPDFAKDTTQRGYVGDIKNTPEALGNPSYVGEYAGFYIFKCPELAQKRIESADGDKTSSWGLVLGAGAGVVAWGGKGVIQSKINEQNQSLVVFAHEYRGQKMLRFTGRYAQKPGAVAGSNPLVEQACLHVFTSI